MKERRRYFCPTCKKEVRLDEPYFPFCCQRCRLIDLGDWLDERHRVREDDTRGERPPDDEAQA